MTEDPREHLPRVLGFATALLLLACSGSARHDDPERAMHRCATAVHDLDPSFGDMAAVDRACAGLFAEPTCRAAVLETSAGDRTARNATVARACAAAYCPTLSAPRPWLCDVSVDELPDEQVAGGWSTLRELALVRDLGSDGGRMAVALDMLERALTVTVSIPIAPATETAPPDDPIIVALRSAPRGFVLTVTNGDRTEEHTVADDPTMEQLAARIPAARGPSPRAVIRADRTVPQSHFVRLVDALRSAGYTRYAIDVRPSAPSQ